MDQIYLLYYVDLWHIGVIPKLEDHGYRTNHSTTREYQGRETYGGR